MCASGLPRNGLNLSQSRSCFHGKWAKCTECVGPTNKIITKNDNAKITKNSVYILGNIFYISLYSLIFYRRYESFVRVTNLWAVRSSATFGATLPGENNGGNAYVFFFLWPVFYSTNIQRPISVVFCGVLFLMCMTVVWLFCTGCIFRDTSHQYLVTVDQ